MAVHLQRLFLFRGEFVLGQTFELFLYKWRLLERLFAIIGLTETRSSDKPANVARLKFDIEEVKAAIRPKATRLDLSQIENLKMSKVQFSNVLKSGPDRQQVERICMELASQLPTMKFQPDLWADDTSIYAAANVMFGAATEGGLLTDPREQGCEFTRRLQEILADVSRKSEARVWTPSASDLGVSLVRADRGLGEADISDDPRRYRVGDRVRLELSPSQDLIGAAYDVYGWQTWWSPAGTYPWELGGDRNPLLLVLPPKQEVLLSARTVLLTTEVSGDTGLGWHFVGLIGAPSSSDLAARCRQIVGEYRAAAGRTNSAAYDLRTHMRLMREFYFFQGKHRRKDEAGAASAHPEILVANCSFEIVG